MLFYFIKSFDVQFPLFSPAFVPHRQRKYAEAQKIKRIADELEKRERMKMDEHRLKVFQQREQKFRQQQKQELASLLKRIDVRRREHVKQRERDTKRLLQRNRNVQQVLESKQALELNRRKQEIRLSLAPKQHAVKAAMESRNGTSSLSPSRSGVSTSDRKSAGSPGKVSISTPAKATSK